MLEKVKAANARRVNVEKEIKELKSEHEKEKKVIKS